MQDSQSIQCPVCLHPFDSSKHIPKIFPTCGHTVCEECLIQVLKMNRPKCPLDKLDFPKDFQKIQAFPTNFLGKDLLEIGGSWSRCSTHQEKNKVICLTDHTLICGNCVIFGAHKGHKVKLLADLQSTAKQKQQQLQGISDKISKSSNEFSAMFEEKRQIIKNKIQERFQSLRFEIMKQEYEMLLTFDRVLAEEKEKLEKQIKKASDPSSLLNIEEKIKEFSDYKILSSPDITKLLEQDFSDIEKAIDEKLLITTTKNTEELSELLTIFQDALPKEDIFKGFPNIIEPLNQQLMRFNDDKLATQEELTQLKISEVKLNIFEDLENNFKTMKIKATEDVGSFTFERAKLEQIQSLRCDLTLRNHTVNEKILAAISLLSKSLTNLKSVYINLEETYFSEVADQVFLSFLLSIFSHLQNIEEIDITVQNCPIGDFGISYFIEKFLPRFQNLKVFSLDLFNIQTTGRLLKTLADANLSNHANLQKFHLLLQEIDLNEEYVIPFFSKLPNVKDLLLGFGETSLTDRALEVFATQSLPALDRVEILDLGLWENKITDRGVQKLFANIPNTITKLFIGLDQNKITDACLQDFVALKLPLLTHLKELDLKVSDTGLSSDLIKKIDEWTTKFPRKEDDDDDDDDKLQISLEEDEEENEEEDDEDENEEEDVEDDY